MTTKHYDGEEYDYSTDIKKYNLDLKKYRHVPIYFALRDKIIDDALAELPIELKRRIGYYCTAVLLEGLQRMREHGYGVAVVLNSNVEEFECSFNVKVGIENNKYVFSYNNKRIDNSKILMFGNIEEPLQYKLLMPDEMKVDLLVYHRLMQIWFENTDTQTFVHHQMPDLPRKLEEAQESPEAHNALMALLKSVGKWNKNKVVTTDERSNVTVLSKPEVNLKEQIEMRKFNICSSHKIPYNKLFGDTSSGLNSTGDYDKANWDTALKLFQALHILPVIRKYGNIIGKPNILRGIELEPIDISDKLLQAQIDGQKINNLGLGLSYGLITREEASEKYREIMQIKPSKKQFEIIDGNTNKAIEPQLYNLNNNNGE